MATKASKTSKDDAPGEDDIREQIAQLKADIASLTDMVAKAGAAKGSEVADKVKGVANDASAKAQDKFHDFEAEATAYINEKPGTAVAIAAGLGFVFGYLTGRK